MPSPQLGRDCPICRQPNMLYVGKSILPLTYEYEEGGVMKSDHVWAEFYRCPICDHIEWKKVDEEK